MLAVRRRFGIQPFDRPIRGCHGLRQVAPQLGSRDDRRVSGGLDKSLDLGQVTTRLFV